MVIKKKCVDGFQLLTFHTELLINIRLIVSNTELFIYDCLATTKTTAASVLLARV